MSQSTTHGHSIVDPQRAGLTHRERFSGGRCTFSRSTAACIGSSGYLGATIARWHQEGLPAEIQVGEGAGSVEAYFGVDPTRSLPVHHGLEPGFPATYEVLEKKADTEVWRMADGMVQEVKTEGVRTIPHYIKFPVETRDDWKRYKERLNPASPERHRVDWRKLGEELRHETRPVGVWIGSFFGTPRDWIGFENIALMCYDDRELIEEIVETITVGIEDQLERALSEVEVDYAAGWEDICFRNGPIIGPAMFGEIVAPRVRRVCNILRRHGCDVIWTDCDGDVRPLVPVWLEAGLNCMFPLEIQGGSDPVELRAKYGKQILLRGGLAKYEFTKGRRETLVELKRVEKVFEEGGYIPHGDHRIPEDVPYENYKYYVREKLTMMGWSKADIAGVWPLRDIK